MCFRKKTSSVRRRYNDFVWLRNSLENNALIMYVPHTHSCYTSNTFFFALYFPPIVSFFCNHLQRNTQAATLEPVLQSEEHRSCFTKNERFAGVFRKVSRNAFHSVGFLDNGSQSF